MNPVLIAILLMLILALARMNIVVVLTFSAVVGGLLAGLSLTDTIQAFESGLGNGATIALGYVMLGTFAVAISRSGITDLLAQRVIKGLRLSSTPRSIFWFKYMLLTIILALAISSQNLIPIHIAMIPIVIPPLLHVFSQLNLDRRMVACILTFGLTTPYILIPVGFGGIFLNEILLKNLNAHGLSIQASQIPTAMLIPAAGMVMGLLFACFISYRKPRHYMLSKILAVEPEHASIQWRYIIVALLATIVALFIQLLSHSVILGALSGFIIFLMGGVVHWRDNDDVFTKGVHMMGIIGFIMIAAAGFASVMQATGGVETLVTTVQHMIGNSRGLAAFMMLFVGLLVTLGIGSSFSTVPIIATIYVPLALSFGFSELATIALVGTAAALGDAGSPVSDSTLGPTSGLNVDGQHDHMWDSVVPTFLHYNIPLLVFGWIAAMVL